MQNIPGAGLPGLLALPPLPTLHQLPSWCNLKGGIDRSACIELRVSELRRIAGCVHIDTSQHDSRGRALYLTSPLPDERPAPRRFPNNIHRLSTGTFNITAEQLHNLHSTRQPRTLAGDFRTNRANSMRDPHQLQPQKAHALQCAALTHPKREQSECCAATRATPRVAPPPPQTDNHQPKTRFRSRITRANPIAWPPDRNLTSNPNKGAARSKIISLPETWSQTLRLEKWLYPNRIQPVYYLICPNHKSHQHSALSHQPNQAGAKRVSRSDTSDAPGPTTPNSSFITHHSALAPPPPLSTRPPSREHPSTKRCPQRCLKLLMIQCTPQESLDAEIAQQWINRIHSLPNATQLINNHPVLSTQYSALITRYGPIFQPRTLLCPRCLNVRYGNNPETVRQGWRRRNKKPNTTRTSNLHHATIPLSKRDQQYLNALRQSIQSPRKKKKKQRKPPPHSGAGGSHSGCSGKQPPHSGSGSGSGSEGSRSGASHFSGKQPPSPRPFRSGGSGKQPNPRPSHSGGTETPPTPNLNDTLHWLQQQNAKPD